jgi:DNA-binding transcriptional LysR family regulator
MHDVYSKLRGVDLNLLLAFEALLAERHVTRAAKRLGVTQPAASHALSRLRGLFGDPLLVRGARGEMIPTRRAEALSTPVHRMLVDLVGLMRTDDFDPRAARRTFRICANDYTELVLLPRLAKRLGDLSPGVDLWVHPFIDWPDERLASGALDVVIGPPRGRKAPAGNFERVVFDEGFTCVVRKGHPLAGANMTLRRFCAAQHLMVSPRGTPGSLVDTALEKLGQQRRIAMAVPHFLVVPHIIEGSDLVATLPTRIAARFAQSLNLVSLRLPLAVAPFEIAVSWHERHVSDPAHRWFREELLAVATSIKKGESEPPMAP